MRHKCEPQQGQFLQNLQFLQAHALHGPNPFLVTKNIDMAIIA